MYSRMFLKPFVDWWFGAWLTLCTWWSQGWRFATSLIKCGWQSTVGLSSKLRCSAYILLLSGWNSRLLFYSCVVCYQLIVVFLLPTISDSHLYLWKIYSLHKLLGVPSWLSGKEPACQCTRDSGSIPGVRRSSGVWSGNQLQYSCL